MFMKVNFTNEHSKPSVRLPQHQSDDDQETYENTQTLQPPDTPQTPDYENKHAIDEIRRNKLQPNCMSKCFFHDVYLGHSILVVVLFCRF